MDNIDIDTSELMDTIKVRPKRGRRPKTVTKKVLDRLYRLVYDGLVYDKDIYPKLLVSQEKWYQWKRENPQIIETIEAAQNARIERVMTNYDSILFNPTHKNQHLLLKHAVDRHDRQMTKDDAIKVDLTVRPLAALSDEELLKDD